ncbi:hypothetical protein BC829DRAFT_401798 [Chytridium lagenaria]|nr:hypothetical protein BC829DRAFT_401798 [Chytridium lagenaria]
MTYEDFVERPEWPYPAPALAIIVLQPPSPTDTSPTPLIAPNTASSLPADYSYAPNPPYPPHFSSSFWTGDSIPYEYADYVRELRKRQDKVVELPPDNQVAPRPFMQKDNGIPLSECVEGKLQEFAESEIPANADVGMEGIDANDFFEDVRNGKDRQSSRFSMWLRHELAGPRQLLWAEYFVSTNRLVRSQSAPSAPNSAQTSTQTMTSSDSTESDSQSGKHFLTLPNTDSDHSTPSTDGPHISGNPLGNVGAASGVRMVEGSDAVLVVPGLHIPSDESDDEFTRNYSEYGDSVDWDFICGDVMNGYYEVGAIR